MATLESYGREVHSIFQLLGEKENDITLSMSWALTRCPEFLKAVVQHICGLEPDTDAVTVMNQKYDADSRTEYFVSCSSQGSSHPRFASKMMWKFL